VKKRFRQGVLAGIAVAVLLEVGVCTLDLLGAWSANYAVFMIPFWPSSLMLMALTGDNPSWFVAEVFALSFTANGLLYGVLWSAFGGFFVEWIQSGESS
jgi:hypothetical protein